MKSAFIISAALLFSNCMPAQTDTTAAEEYEIMEISGQPEPEVFMFVEQMPEFPGGEDSLMQFISRNIIYPKYERDSGIAGKVIVKFVVNADGSVGDVTIARSVSPGLDKEALRIVKSMPLWKPARQQGKAVRVYFMLPVRFTLD